MPFLLPCSKKSQIVSLFFSGMLEVEGFLCTPLFTFWGCGLLIWPFPPAGLLFMRLLFKCFWGWTIDVWLLLFTLSWALFKAPLAAADSRASLKNVFLSREHLFYAFYRLRIAYNTWFLPWLLLFLPLFLHLCSLPSSQLWTGHHWINENIDTTHTYIPHLDEELIILRSNILISEFLTQNRKLHYPVLVFPQLVPAAYFQFELFVCCLYHQETLEHYVVGYCCCNSSQQSRSKAKSRNEKRL